MAITDGIMSVVVPFGCMSILSELDYTKKPYTTLRGLCDFRLNRVQIRSNMMIIVGPKIWNEKGINVYKCANERDREGGKRERERL